MPLGDVRLEEFAETVVRRLERDVPALRERVKFIDADADTTDDVRISQLGAEPYGVVVEYGDPAVAVGLGFNNVAEFAFTLRLTVVYRKLGAMDMRLRDSLETDITMILKDTVLALIGDRLGLFNVGGVEILPAEYRTDESSIQLMSFTAIGRSRESRGS